jgi:hypothetical protein
MKLIKTIIFFQIILILVGFYYLLNSNYFMGLFNVSINLIGLLININTINTINKIK